MTDCKECPYKSGLESLLRHIEELAMWMDIELAIREEQGRPRLR